MAVKTNDIIINLADFSSGLKLADAKNKTAIRIDDLSIDNISNLDFKIDGSNLVITNTLDENKKIFIQNFNKLKYIKTNYVKEGKDESYELYDIILNNLVDNSLTNITYSNKTTVTGSDYNDSINLTDSSYSPRNNSSKGLTIKGGFGSDTIRGTKYNDTIIGEDGKNSVIYDTNNFGDDTIILTEGETLNINFSNGVALIDSPYTQGNNKNDLLVRTNQGTITLKDYYLKDTGATVKIGGADISKVASLEKITSSYFYDGNKYISKKYTGTALADNIDASGLTNPVNSKVKRGGIVLNTGVSISTGLGDDIIKGSNFNDTITAGVGENTLDYSSYATNDKKFGDDIINLTKDEILNINLEGLTPVYSRGKNKNDLLITVYKDETIKGTITIKNYLAKNTGAKVVVGDVDLSKEAIALTTFNSSYFTPQDRRPISKFQGTALADYVEATEAPVVNYKTLKGITFNTGAGDDTVIGSIYNDVINTGDGDDVITGNFGNDTITGGAGKNIINCTRSIDGNDTIILTKGENLVLNLNNLEGNEEPYNINNIRFAFSKDKKDLLIYTDKNTLTDISGVVTIKNFGLKDVTNNSTSKNEDTSSIELMFNGDENTKIDLRKAISIDVDTVSNFTGTWLSEDISADEFEITKKVNGELVLNENYSAKGLTLNGGDGNDKITGTIYSDTISGGEGNDIIFSNGGNDKLSGGLGRDTFLFTGLEDGAITITDATSSDTVKITDVKAKNIDFIQNGNNLEIYTSGYTTEAASEYSKEPNRIIIQNYFKTNDKLNKIIAKDREILLSETNIPILAKGATKGTADSETFITQGKTINITPNKGNDTIYADSKNTVISFKEGDGKDIVYTSYSPADNSEDEAPNPVTLAFASNTKLEFQTRESITGNNTVKDIIISYGNSGDSVTVADYNKDDKVNIKIGNKVKDLSSYELENAPQVKVFNTNEGDVVKFKKGDGHCFINHAYHTDCLYVFEDLESIDDIQITKDEAGNYIFTYNDGKDIIETDDDFFTLAIGDEVYADCGGIFTGDSKEYVDENCTKFHVIGIRGENGTEFNNKEGICYFLSYHFEDNPDYDPDEYPEPTIQVMDKYYDFDIITYEDDDYINLQYFNDCNVDIYAGAGNDTIHTWLPWPFLGEEEPEERITKKVNLFGEEGNDTYRIILNDRAWQGRWTLDSLEIKDSSGCDTLTMDLIIEEEQNKEELKASITTSLAEHDGTNIAPYAFINFDKDGNYSDLIIYDYNSLIDVPEYFLIKDYFTDNGTIENIEMKYHYYDNYYVDEQTEIEHYLSFVYRESDGNYVAIDDSQNPYYNEVYTFDDNSFGMSTDKELLALYYAAREQMIEEADSIELLTAQAAISLENINAIQTEVVGWLNNAEYNPDGYNDLYSLIQNNGLPEINNMNILTWNVQA